MVTTDSGIFPVRLVLLDKSQKRSASFSMLKPTVVSSAGVIAGLARNATKGTLWISYDKSLTDALVRAVCGVSRLLGNAVLVHSLSVKTLPVLAGSFNRIAFSSADEFLPAEELAEVLQVDNAKDLFIGGSVDDENQVIVLWRGDLESLTVPFAAFEPSGDGVTPDFGRLSVTDFGQTIRLGEYEAAADAILYEFDPDYRRRIAKQRRGLERSFGASVYRLRKQRRLRRTDFEPDVSAKTIARIEQGKVKNIHKKTLGVIAHRLQVKPEEIQTF